MQFNLPSLSLLWCLLGASQQCTETLPGPLIPTSCQGFQPSSCNAVWLKVVLSLGKPDWLLCPSSLHISSCSRSAQDYLCFSGKRVLQGNPVTGAGTAELSNLWPGTALGWVFVRGQRGGNPEKLCWTWPALPFSQLQPLCRDRELSRADRWVGGISKIHPVLA